MKVKIKEEYRNKKIYVGGTEYDFPSYTQGQLSLLWEHTPRFREYLEVDSEGEFFSNKPEDVTEGEFFESEIKKVVGKKRNK